MFLAIALGLTVLAAVSWAGGDIVAASWLMLAALASWTIGLARAQPRTRGQRRRSWRLGRNRPRARPADDSPER